MDDRQSGIKTAPEARNGVSLQIKGMSCQVLWSDSASRPYIAFLHTNFSGMSSPLENR